MKGKVLFVATVLRGHILVFHLPYMRWFREQGYEVHLCCSNDTPEPNIEVPYCNRFIELPFERNPLSKGNVRVYRELKKLIDTEHYALIHCNTPVGGMLARLAARHARKKGTRVVYTAHGFHFFKGAPLKNWLLYYPAERFLSRFTDLLITIDGEDEQYAKHFHQKKLARVNGVGVDLTRFDHPKDRALVRKELGIGENEPVAICVGEHSTRKNHAVVIRIARAIPELKVLFCGVGEKQAELEALAKELGVSDRVYFLGFRKDVPDLLSASDVFVFPSLQEGLPVAQMEAMAAGLPCVVSKVRGNEDLILQGDGGFLREAMDVNGFAEDVKTLISDPLLCKRMGERNRQEMQKYSLSAVLKQMEILYKEQLS